MFDHDRSKTLFGSSVDDLRAELKLREELQGATLEISKCVPYEAQPKFKTVAVKYPSSVGLFTYHHNDVLETEKARHDVFLEGLTAFKRHQKIDQNPYSHDPQRNNWLQGWEMGHSIAYPDSQR